VFTQLPQTVTKAEGELDNEIYQMAVITSNKNDTLNMERIRRRGGMAD
jgi:hypothetical protein